MVVNDPSIRPIFVSFIWNWGSLGLLDSHTCSWVWARSANGTAWRRTRKLRSCSSAAHFLGWIHGSKFPPLTIKHKEKRLKLDFQFVGGTSRLYVLYLSLSLYIYIYTDLYIIHWHVCVMCILFVLIYLQVHLFIPSRSFSQHQNHPKFRPFDLRPSTKTSSRHGAPDPDGNIDLPRSKNRYGIPLGCFQK